MLVTTQRFTALFIGTFAILTGFGLTASVLSLTLGAQGDTGWVGVVGVTYFVGLGFGSLRAERIIADVGYLRAYGMLSAVACLGVLCIALVDHPAAWALARGVQGLALGGLFVCLESWMASSTEPSARGSVLATYQVVIYLGLMLGQLLLGGLANDLPRAMIVAAACLCLAALPVGAITQEPPRLVVMPRIRVGELWSWASVGVVGALVSGLTTGAVYTVAPAAGTAAGLTQAEVGWLMMSFIGGGLVLQLPLGRASDLYDRRVVLGSIAAVAATGGALSMLLLARPAALITVSAVLGGGVFAIYTIALAYTYDRVPPEQAVSANASLLAVFCVGSAVGSGGSSAALSIAGPVGFYAALTLPSIVLALLAFRASGRFGALPHDQRSRASWMPRTSSAVVELDPRVDLSIASGVELHDEGMVVAPEARHKE